MIKVRAHTCYLGNTGYAHHSRNFFRELSKHVDLRIRNYTWDNNPDYLDEIDLGIIDTITLRNNENLDEDFHISRSFPNLNWKHKDSNFSQDVDIVLMDSDHHYFYEEYNSNVKIAYTVWESTELPEGFFNQLLKFDYLWVATKWHKEVAVKQGYPSYRVFVINEGVNEEFFKDGEFTLPSEENDGRFKFMFFGRWDYRKSVPEIIDSFLKAFPNNEEVDLIISADNPYSVDGMKSTEERLAHYGYNDSRIKVKHFLNREDYISYIRKGNVLITCARSEGWNIPLIEAMASGTPVIYSDWGGQLEFAYGKGNPVKIKKELPANIGAKLGFAGDTPGLYAEPDFEDLKRVMVDCFENWAEKKAIARKESEEIYNLFNWEKIGIDGYNTLKKLFPAKIDSPTKGEAAVIMAHCDTREKILALTRCIISLKSQGYFTIVCSHIPLPDYIIEICDYFVCETDNPVIEKDEYVLLSNTTPVHWFNYNEYELVYPFDFNHGFAALRLIYSGVFTAIMNGFDKTHFVNYDYIIDNPEILISHSDSLDHYSIVSYKWNEHRSINSGFFSARSKDLLNCIQSTRSKSDYFRFEGVVILEDFLYNCIEENGIAIDLRNISECKGDNFFNSFVAPAYPYIKTKSGHQAHIYLGKDSVTGEYFVCASGSVTENIEGEIRYKGNSVKIESPFHPLHFYPVTDDMLEDGFSVYIPKYDVNYNYDKNSRMAIVKVKDRSLIVKGIEKEPSISVNFIDGPFVEIKEAEGREFNVQFIDKETNELKYETNIGNNSWARCSIRYFKNWIIKIRDLSNGRVYKHVQDLRNKNVLICIESSSLGDSLSWFPYAEEFKKIHGCNVYVSTFQNNLFSKEYEDINFIEPGTSVNNIYALYRIGWFYNGEAFNSNMHPRDFKNLPLQSTASDILGLNYKETKPRITLPKLPRPIESKYVCIAMHSTTQAKYWNNPTGWQEVTDWLINLEYEVVMLSKEENGYMGNYYPSGVTLVEGERTLTNAINYLQHSDMFIGIGSGLSWLSWATGIPTVIISGFSSTITEPVNDKIIRIFNGTSCNSCFNRYKLDAGDWNWCPDHKETERQFECTKSISGKEVIDKLNEYLNTDIFEKSVDIIIDESYALGMIQNRSEIVGAAEFFKQLGVKKFMEIGTDQGGTFAIWSKLSVADDKRISVDMPHGNYGVDHYDVNKRDEFLRSLGSDVTMIHGDSHSEGIKNRVGEMLNEGELDFLFIDGDHSYEGVKKDYEDYNKYVKPGGWIGFHDIKDTEYHRSANCRVDILWNELRGEKVEFLDNSSNFGGIGFIKKQ